MLSSKITLGLCVVLVAVAIAYTASHAADPEAAVAFSGGHDIGRKDFGRPISLIAAALKVEPDVFREAFSGVTPARGGGGPSREEAQRNKAALMKVLAPHGVTNDRLDEVSNYYRYQPQKGDLWKNTPAKAHAVVVDGKIKSIVVDEPGSGYCNPPEVTVKGFESVPLKVTLHFDTDMKKNGSIASIEVVKP